MEISIKGKLSFIHHLSKIGLDKRAITIPLLNNIKEIIPSYSCTFLWFNHHHQITCSYDDSPLWPKVAFNYFTNFFNKTDTQAHPNLADWQTKNNRSIPSRNFFYSSYYESETYLKIWKYLEYYHSLIASVNKNNIPVGILMLHRKEAEQPYTDKDARSLDKLLPIIAEGLSRDAENSPLTGTDTVGTVVFNQELEVEYASPLANKLIFLCSHPSVPERRQNTTPRDVDNLFDRIRTLCDLLVSNYNNNQAPNAEKFFLTNRWGGFTFIANWLQPPYGPNSGLVAVNIHYHEPVRLKALRNCYRHSLTDRQIEVSMLLCRGRTFEEIARELNVSVHTVIDHIKKVYEKLEVGNRSEVIQRLTLEDTGSQIPQALSYKSRFYATPC